MYFAEEMSSKGISSNRTQVVRCTGTISQYPCKISCKAQWDKKNEPIEFQRVILKEDARTKFGGSNPMQPTVIEGEKTCTGIRDAIKAGICSDANKK